MKKKVRHSLRIVSYLWLIFMLVLNIYVCSQVSLNCFGNMLTCTCGFLDILWQTIKFGSPAILILIFLEFLE